jgi:PPOX class probable F420-dependent enzyme
VTPALPPAACENLLTHWPVARLATIGVGGKPHLVPVVFASSDGALWSPIDGKPKRDGELERVRNLRRDPRATLLIDHYENDWRRLFWLRVEGRAALRRLRAEPRSDEQRAAAALRAKYPQYRGTPLFRGEPTLLRIAIEELRSWCADPEASRELWERKLA